MRPCTVGYLAGAAQIGGGNRSLLTLLEALPRREWSAVVFLPAPGPLADALDRRGIPWEVVPFDRASARRWPLPLASRLWHYYRLLRKHDVRLLHANTLGGYRPAGLAARLARIPRLVHIRFYENEDGFRYAVKAAPDALIFNSRHVYDCMAGFVSRLAPHARCQVIYNAVDLERFRPAGPDSPRPEDLGIAGRGPIVGMVGNLMPIKGQRYFLEMIALLRPRYPEVRYVIVGQDLKTDGAYEQYLRRLADRLGVADVVQFLGFRDDVAHLFAVMQVILCPSLEEPFGRVLIEAGACARPVVASAVGGIPEVVVDGVTGLLVPPGDPPALAAAVARLLDDPARANAMGRAARDHVSRLFSVSAHVARIEALYKLVLAQARPRPPRPGRQAPAGVFA